MTISATVTKSFKWRGVVQEVGTVIQIPVDRLSQFEKFIATKPVTDGRDLPHYCQPGDCWCSEKLPGRGYPSGCVRIGCEYHSQLKTIG